MLSLASTSMAWSQQTRLAWIKGVFRNPAKVGAIAPCSSYVADELTRYIMHEDRKPLRILEVGAGTGPITKEIIKKMNEDDHLDCIELDAVYCDQLEEKFGEHENVHIHCMSIIDFAPTEKYDVIVSTLPFNSLPPKLVQQVVDQYNEIIKPGGYITYIEYVVLGNVKRLVLSKEKKAAWDVKQQTLKEWFGRYGVERKIVWRNLPPSYVYYLKIDKVENEKEKSKTI